MQDFPASDMVTARYTSNVQTAVIDPAREFYVTVRDGIRTGWLLGPFDDHQKALDNVQRARNLAEQGDPRAAWYAFGTASTPKGTNMPTVF